MWRMSLQSLLVKAYVLEIMCFLGTCKHSVVTNFGLNVSICSRVRSYPRNSVRITKFTSHVVDFGKHELALTYQHRQGKRRVQSSKH